jgi:NADH-quinone oxidoreductase subunit B
MYLPGCPPRPEMLLDAFLKLHDDIQHSKLGKPRLALEAEREAAALAAAPTLELKGLLR